jgi:hypothetical protein
MQDDDFLALEATYMNLTTSMLDKNISPYAMAAVMVKIALMIYKSSLNPEEYNSMVNSISDSRNEIKSFDVYGNTNRLN